MTFSIARDHHLSREVLVMFVDPYTPKMNTSHKTKSNHMSRKKKIITKKKNHRSKKKISLMKGSLMPKRKKIPESRCCKN